MSGLTGAPAAPIIVSALFHAEDLEWLDVQRRRYFPPERNHLPAHLTLFHHLPPSAAAEVKAQLAAACRDAQPEASIAGLRGLGRGVAYAVRSPALEVIRADMAARLATLLTPQDRAGWRPHVTIQNKVEPEQARALLSDLAASFAPRALRIAGLAAWWYRGGPWEPLAAYRFSRSGRPRRN